VTVAATGFAEMGLVLRVGEEVVTLSCGWLPPALKRDEDERRSEREAHPR
jgi:hypothetical protein